MWVTQRLYVSACKCLRFICGSTWESVRNKNSKRKQRKTMRKRPKNFIHNWRRLRWRCWQMHLMRKILHTCFVSAHVCVYVFVCLLVFISFSVSDSLRFMHVDICVCTYFLCLCRHLAQKKTHFCKNWQLKYPSLLWRRQQSVSKKKKDSKNEVFILLPHMQSLKKASFFCGAKKA